MGLIKDLPPLDRPREKALRYGIECLSDIELIALLLGSGFKGSNIIEISTALINKYGGLIKLSEVPFSELKKNKGIKKVRSINLTAVFELHKRLNAKTSEQNEELIDSEYLYNKYRYLLSSKQETLMLIILSSKKKLIFETVLCRGGANSIIYSYDDIYRHMISYGGKYFYLIHNHPNGDASPSEEDLISTSVIDLRSKREKRPLIDHIIIGSNEYYSFRQKKKIYISC